MEEYEVVEQQQLVNENDQDLSEMKDVAKAAFVDGVTVFSTIWLINRGGKLVKSILQIFH